MESSAGPSVAHLVKALSPEPTAPLQCRLSPSAIIDERLPVVLGTKPKASSLQSKFIAAELHPQNLFHISHFSSCHAFVFYYNFLYCWEIQICIK